MDSQTLKQRTTAQNLASDDVDVAGKPPPRRDRRITKRGLLSLSVSIAVAAGPAVVSMCAGCANSYPKTVPFWFPPLWALRAMTSASAFLMGLAAWLVWAEGGFHASPWALYFYVVQLGMGAAWDPLVFGSGAVRLGLAVCAGMFGSSVGCYQFFAEIDVLAGRVIAPCLGWTAFLCLVNLILLYI